MSTITFAQFDGGVDLSRPGNIQGANRFRVLLNAYVTKGKTIRKRPGARYVWSWGKGVKGLFAINGSLRGFYGDGNTEVMPVTAGAFNQSLGIYQATRLLFGAGGANGDNQVIDIVTSFRFAGGLYVVAQMLTGYRHFFGATFPLAAITDVNCPHGRHALPLRSKVFATSATGVVRFSKTENPTDWTAANDAGFLPTNNQASGSGSPVALGEFLKKLVVFYPNAAQIWNVGPDPATHSFDQRIVIGTQYSDAHFNVGSDLFFASPDGIRSIVLASQFGNAMDVDVGTPVDRLYSKILEQPARVFSRYFPSLGQFWFINGPDVMVYSFSRTSKVFAWSQYQFPWAIVGADELNGKAYVRSLAGDIYAMEESYPVDDEADLAVSRTGLQRSPSQWAAAFPNYGQINIPVSLKTPFFDMKMPGTTKIINAFDIVATRSNAVIVNGIESTYTMDCFYRSGSLEDHTLAGPIDLMEIEDDTRGGFMNALGLMTPTLAVEINHSAPEDYELSALLFDYST